MCSTATSGRIKIERSKGRVYIVGDTYSAKDRIKALGGHWDGDRRAWWVGAAKVSEAEALVAKLNGDATASGGATNNAAAPAKEDADGIRLVGKAKYKGRTYYARWIGECKSGDYKARLITLDQSLDFWAACARPHETQHDGSGDVAVIVKTYQAREVRYGYGRHSRTEYTTLGSIKRFIERESRNRADGGPVCAECGKTGELILDHEDGAMKHRNCCDIPSE